MSATSGAGTGALSGAGATGPRERPGDLRSAELVSRLLAATPPYLYNMPIVPHSYFFSEMLRSFVHAKNNADVNRIPPQSAIPHRRSRKRSWNQSKMSPDGLPHSKSEWPHRSDQWPMRSVTQEERHQQFDDKYPEVQLDNNKNLQHGYEKPLELTTNKNTLSKINNVRISEQGESEEKRRSPEIDVQTKMRKSPKVLDVSNHLKDEKYSGLVPPAAPVPPALTLPPPPPPLWYPPIYPPPYGIDPLNFFIDLRVSGHIYDRKHGKDAQNPPSNSETPQQDAQLQNSGPLIFENGNSSAFKENVKSNRHMSAFSVPKPRDSGKHFPINLCHNGNGKFNMKYYDDVDAKLQESKKMKNMTNTHYVMQNLKRIYGDLSNGGEDGDTGKQCVEPEASEDLDGADDSDSSETKKKRCKDLRALIGLELVVDYVKGGRVDPNKNEGPASDVEVLDDQ